MARQFQCKREKQATNPRFLHQQSQRDNLEKLRSLNLAWQGLAWCRAKTFEFVVSVARSSAIGETQR